MKINKLLLVCVASFSLVSCGQQENSENISSTPIESSVTPQEVIQSAASKTTAQFTSSIDEDKLLNLDISVKESVGFTYKTVKTESYREYNSSDELIAQKETILEEKSFTIKESGSAEVAVNYDTAFYAGKSKTNETSLSGIASAEGEYTKNGEKITLSGNMSASYKDGALNYLLTIVGADGSSETQYKNEDIGTYVDNYASQFYTHAKAISEKGIQAYLLELASSYGGDETNSYVTMVQSAIETLLPEIQKWIAGETTSLEFSTVVFNYVKKVGGEEKCTEYENFLPYAASVLDTLKNSNFSSVITIAKTSTGYSATLDYAKLKLTINTLLMGLKTATENQETSLGKETVDYLTKTIDIVSETLNTYLPRSLSFVGEVVINDGFLTGIKGSFYCSNLDNIPDVSSASNSFDSSTNVTKITETTNYISFNEVSCTYELMCKISNTPEIIDIVQKPEE